MHGMLERIRPHLDGRGVSEEAAAAVLGAMDAAGLAPAPRGRERAEPVVERVEGMKLAVRGMPGRYLCAARLADRGWVVWLEVEVKGQPLQVMAPTFLHGMGELLKLTNRERASPV